MKFVLKILVLVGLIIIGKYLKDEDQNSALANRVSAAEIEVNTTSHNTVVSPASQSENQNLNPSFNQIPLTTETNSTTFSLN